MADADVELEKPESQVASDDIAADIRATMAEIKGDSDAPLKVTLDRPRDESGKFVERQQQKAEADKRPTLTLPAKQQSQTPADKTAANATATTATTETATTPQTAVTAPIAWSAEMKQVFPTLDPKVQAYIAKREADAHAAISRNDEAVTFGKRAREMAQPYEAIIRSEGGDALGMLQDYLNYAYVFRTATPQNKLAALQNIAQRFNIPLGVPAQQSQAVHPAIETLQQRVERMEQERQQEIQQRQQEEQAGYHAEIAAFVAEPGHDHFETLRQHMGVLLESGLAQNLQDAYDQAANAHPEVRQLLAQAQQQQAAAERNGNLASKAVAARRAAVSVTGAPGSSRPAAANGSVGSVEDDLRAAYRQVSGRV